MYSSLNSRSKYIKNRTIKPITRELKYMGSLTTISVAVRYEYKSNNESSKKFNLCCDV